MYQAESGSATANRPAPPVRRHLLAVLAFGLCALLVGLLSTSWASAGAPARESSKGLDLTGVVTKVQKHRVEEEESEEFHSTIDLLSGSKNAGTLDTDDCSSLAIHFLICSGKASVEEFGSGLFFHIEWPCPENGISPCSSVGHGILSKGAKTIATIKVKTSLSNFMKLHKRFSVEIQRGAPRMP